VELHFLDEVTPLAPSKSSSALRCPTRHQLCPLVMIDTLGNHWRPVPARRGKRAYSSRSKSRERELASCGVDLSSSAESLSSNLLRAPDLIAHMAA
jgi:hypothetical protein